MPAGLSWLLQFVLAMVAMVVATVPRSGAVETSPGAQSTRLPLRYDIPALQAYFSHHPVLVLQRNTEVVGKLSQFFLAILADWRMGKWDSNMPERARWARHIVQELGPAYIKIAQASSAGLP
jgi:aarF domain-containing kinase